MPHHKRFDTISKLGLAFCFAIGAPSLQAQVQSRTGVRADAMGGAFVAVSNDVNALQFSPAGLLNSIQRTQVEFGHHRLFSGLNNGNITLNNLGAVYNISSDWYPSDKDKLIPELIVEARPEILASSPRQLVPDTSVYRINRLSFGVQWLGLQFPGRSQNTIMISANIGLSGLGLLPAGPDTIHDPHKLDPNKRRHRSNLVSLGLSARYIRFGYDEDYLLDPNAVNDAAELTAIENFLATNNIETSDWAIDASLAVYLSPKLQAAVSILNLKQPNLAAKSNDGGKKLKDGQLARRYRAGVAYRLRPNLLAAIDVEKNEKVEALVDDVNIHAGAEYLWQNNFVPMFLRGGINRNWLAAGLGLQFERILRQDLVFNWVYQYSLHGQGLSNLRFALDYGWR
jgi:hypothetical protein